MPAAEEARPSATRTTRYGAVLPSRLFLGMVACAAILAAAALPMAWISAQRDLGRIDQLPGMAAWFEITQPRNLATWYSALLLAVGSWLSFQISRLRRRSQHRDAHRWTAASIVLALMACEEIALFHEVAGGPLRSFLGDAIGPAYASALPSAFAALITICYCGPLWFRLPRPIRAPLFWASVLYIGAALGLDTFTDSWARETGWTQSARILSVMEETIEMVAIAIAVQALVNYRERLVRRRNAAPYTVRMA